MRKSWEFALAGTGTCIGTAIFAPHERSLRMANMTAAFIVGGLAPRAERLDGAVEAALQAFGSRAAAEPILSGLSSGFSAYSHEIESAFAVVGPAGSIRAVRPTLPQGS
jgi:hypothetical protein